MPTATNTDGKAIRIKALFTQFCSVATTIQAPPEHVWSLITDVTHILAWNSTIVSLEGTIAGGNKIKLVSTLDPNRTFTLTITELTAPHKLVWESGFFPLFKGVRTYELTPQDDGITTFTMTEVFSGLLLPLISGSLPDFKPNFEQIAADLKKAAESGIST